MTKVTYKSYKCRACGHVQSMQTNHTGQCFGYCHECSWKMRYCAPENCVPMFGRMYRPFDYVQTTVGDQQ